MLPSYKVILLGRTNVGKSSLFNRLTESDQAIISNIAGTTRDKNKGCVFWLGYEFQLIDTGGIDLSKPDEIEEHVLEQAWKLVEDANMVLLVTDTSEGLMPKDEEIAQGLRKRGIDFTVVANKADSPRIRKETYQFMPLSTEVIPLSASNGSGTGDLLDMIVEDMKANGAVQVEDKEEEEEIQSEDADVPTPNKKEFISVAIIGMPNMGKSSLLNALVGEEEAIVSSIPHTTREPRDTYINHKNQKFRIIDTAGIRKRRKMRGFFIRESGSRTLDAIKEADWVIFVIDSNSPKYGEQDKYILNEIVLSGKAVVVAANKWDLKKDNPNRFKEFMTVWLQNFGNRDWIPVIPISAMNGWHVTKLLDKIIELEPNRNRILNRSGLEGLLKSAIKRRRPQKKKGPEAPYIHTIKQIDVAPPTFEVVIDYKDTLADSYVRFLSKSLRFKFNFEGTPIRMYIRSVK